MIKVGVKTIDITPPVGLPLAGYPNIQDINGAPDSHKLEDGYIPRTTGSIGKADTLYAKVMAISNQHQTIVFVSLDICVIVGEFTEKVREIVFQQTGLPKEAILLTATHTHSGPDLFSIFDPVDRFYSEKIAYQLAETIMKTLDDMTAVTLTAGKADIGPYIINREQNSGPIDPDLSLIKFENLSGQTVALVVNAPIHPIILSSENLLYSKDVIGYVCATIEQVYKGAVCIFLNGAAGNINPVGYPLTPKQDIVRQHKELKKGGKESIRTFEYAKRLGNLIASEVIKASELAIGVHDTNITFARKEIKIPLKEKQQREAYCEFMNIQEPLKTKVIESDSVKSEVQKFSVGPITFLALPGEPFVEIGLALKKAMPGTIKFIIGYSNTDPRYLPTDKSYQKNNYETFGTPVKQGVEQILLKSGKELLNLANTLDQV